MLRRLSNVLSVVSEGFAAIASALLAVLITYVVFERFVLHTTPHWAEELPRLVLVWLAFVGGVACSHRRTHLMAGLLTFFVRDRRILAWFDRLNHVLLIVALAALGYAGWQLAVMTMDQMLSAVPVSAGIVYLALPVACAATVVVHLTQLFEPLPASQFED